MCALVALCCVVVYFVVSRHVWSSCVVLCCVILVCAVFCVVLWGGALGVVVLCWYVELLFCLVWCCVVVCGVGLHCPMVCRVVGYRGGALMDTGVAVGLVCWVAALFSFFAALSIVLVDNG